MPDFEMITKLLEFLNENPRLKGTIQCVSAAMLVLSWYRYFFRPVWTFHCKLAGTFDKLNIAFPVLMQIADQFKPNGGNSLRDVINRMESKQAASEERILSLLRSSDKPYFEADPEGMYLWVNRRWCELTGMHPDDAIGLGWIGTVLPDDQQKVSDHWRLCISQMREFNLEYSLLTACEDKLIIPIKCTAHVMKDKKKVIGYIGHISELPPRSEQLSFSYDK